MAQRATDLRLVDGIDPEQRYLNRELSWLEFNSRVLRLAGDANLPVLERVKFLAIFGQNIDEFFQVRVAGLKDQVAAGVVARSADGMDPRQQLQAIAEVAGRLFLDHARCFTHDVMPALAHAGIEFCEYDSLSESDCRKLAIVFEDQVFPVLTPLAVDPGHPFPYISNLSLNLAVAVREPNDTETRFARIKVPSVLPRFFALEDGRRYVALEQIIAANLDEMFPGMIIEAHHLFRVVRNADLALEEEEADDLLAAIEVELRRRRFGSAVSLHVDVEMPDDLLSLLMRELELEDSDVYRIPGPLDLSRLFELAEIDRPDLRDEPWPPVTQSRLMRSDDEPTNFFSVLRDRDVLVHHPYDSFASSVEEFIRQAALDPRVLAIKQTLYRTSGDSPIISSLIAAAERGKEVVALVELKARFDEQANIQWARALEEAGVHVVYGLIGLKTHSKTALVVRQETGQIRRYWHIGTGNYNPRTARLYEDIGVMSSNPAFGADLNDLFNYLTGYSRHTSYRKLIVAPHGLRDRLIALINEQTALGEGGRIVLKMNGLVDTAVIDALYEASNAGVKVDLLIRSICCLRPGVPGLSENIRVRSIVGRYLEHSRLWVFGGKTTPARYFIGSADVMPRNLDRRIEVVMPVEDTVAQERLHAVVESNFDDDASAWELDATGHWTHFIHANMFDSQQRLREIALTRGNRRTDAVAPIAPLRRWRPRLGRSK
ncbi:MAG: RNA degradosome polyphosphate kinase [Actinobacteria bacterium]|nr:RNA degradosome polyphosphate kinase [Actinomycetota bacterium]